MQGIEKSDPELAATSTPQRVKYVAPQLVRYGNLTEFTQYGPGRDADGGGLGADTES